jgi:hypothetical protein
VSRSPVGVTCAVIVVMCFTGHEILDRIHQVVDEGVRIQAFQMLPHFIILDQQFYVRHLKPVLAEWAWLWIQDHPKLRESLATAAHRSCLPDVLGAVSKFLGVPLLHFGSVSVAAAERLETIDDLLDPIMVQVLNLTKGLRWFSFHSQR